MFNKNKKFEKIDAVKSNKVAIGNYVKFNHDKHFYYEIENITKANDSEIDPKDKIRQDLKNKKEKKDDLIYHFKGFTIIGEKLLRQKVLRDIDSNIFIFREV